MSAGIFSRLVSPLSVMRARVMKIDNGRRLRLSSIIIPLYLNFLKNLKIGLWSKAIETKNIILLKMAVDLSRFPVRCSYFRKGVVLHNLTTSSYLISANLLIRARTTIYL